MAELEVKNMTVNEIRSELSRHGLDTSGKKADLVARYINYLTTKLEDEAEGQCDVDDSEETQKPEEPLEENHGEGAECDDDDVLELNGDYSGQAEENTMEETTADGEEILEEQHTEEADAYEIHVSADETLAEEGELVGGSDVNASMEQEEGHTAIDLTEENTGPPDGEKDEGKEEPHEEEEQIDAENAEAKDGKSSPTLREMAMQDRRSRRIRKGTQRFAISEMRIGMSRCRFYAYPITPEDLASDTLRPYIEKSERYSLKVAHPNTESGFGKLEMQMATMADAAEAKQVFETLRPEIKVVETYGGAERHRTLNERLGLSSSMDTIFPDIDDNTIMTITGLSKTTTEEKILEVCPGRCVYIPFDKNSVQTGNAYVVFETAEAMKSFLEEPPTSIDDSEVKMMPILSAVPHKEAGTPDKKSESTEKKAAPQDIRPFVDKKVHDIFSKRRFLSKKWMMAKHEDLADAIRLIESTEKELTADERNMIKMGKEPSKTWKEHLTARFKTVRVPNRYHKYLTSEVAELKQFLTLRKPGGERGGKEQSTTPNKKPTEKKPNEKQNQKQDTSGQKQKQQTTTQSDNKAKNKQNQRPEKRKMSETRSEQQKKQGGDGNKKPRNDPNPDQGQRRRKNRNRPQRSSDWNRQTRPSVQQLPAWAINAGLGGNRMGGQQRSWSQMSPTSPQGNMRGMGMGGMGMQGTGSFGIGSQNIGMGSQNMGMGMQSSLGMGMGTQSQGFGVGAQSFGGGMGSTARMGAQGNTTTIPSLLPETSVRERSERYYTDPLGSSSSDRDLDRYSSSAHRYDTLDRDLDRPSRYDRESEKSDSRSEKLPSEAVNLLLNLTQLLTKKVAEQD